MSEVIKQLNIQNEQLVEYVLESREEDMPSHTPAADGAS